MIPLRHKTRLKRKLGGLGGGYGIPPCTGLIIENIKATPAIDTHPRRAGGGMDRRRNGNCAGFRCNIGSPAYTTPGGIYAGHVSGA